MAMTQFPVVQCKYEGNFITVTAVHYRNSYKAMTV